MFGSAPDYPIRLEALSAHSYKEAHSEDESPHYQHRGHVHSGGHGELPVGGVNLVPDFTFGDGEEITVGDVTLKAIQTPGHTPGHSCFYHEPSGAVFTGDHILKRITPNPGIHFDDEDYGKRMHSLPEYVRSLRKVLALDAKRVLPAHEEEIYDLPASVERIIHHHERRSEKVLEAVVEGRARPFDVLPHVFPALRAFALMPAMAEIIGHLDILEEEGKVIVESDSSMSAPARHSGSRPSCPPTTKIASRPSCSSLAKSWENLLESICLPAGSRAIFMAEACLAQGSGFLPVSSSISQGA